jgi:hypothetical protein
MSRIIASSLLISVVFSIYLTMLVAAADMDSTDFRSLQTAVVVGKVDNLILYNAITDSPILYLTDGMVVNIATLNMSSFNVVATTIDGEVGSVKFGYNGKAKQRSETNPPYALCGGSGANLNVCSYLVVGQHNLTVTTYEGKRVNGTIGSIRQLSFRIVNVPSTTSPTRVPTMIPTKAPIVTPTKVPTKTPTNAPTTAPTLVPTAAPIAPAPTTKTPSPLTPTTQVTCNIPKVCLQTNINYGTHEYSNIMV